MIEIIIYCMSCYLFEIGMYSAFAHINENFSCGVGLLLRLLLAPIFAPFDLGQAIIAILSNNNGKD